MSKSKKPQQKLTLKEQQELFNPQEFEHLGIPREEIVEMKQAFDIFDQEGSGIVNPTELKEAFEELGFKGNRKFVYTILSELDETYQEGIQFEDFLKITSSKHQDNKSEQGAKRIFNMFDTQREGKITVKELQQVATELGEEISEEELERMFEKADLDGDGFVTQEDFFNMLNGKVYWD